MNSVLLSGRTYDETTGLVRGITADGREVLLRRVRRGWDNITDGGRMAADDVDWDRQEPPIDLNRVRVWEIF